MRAWVSILGSRSSRNWACRSTVALAKSPVAAIMGTTSEKRPPPRGGGRVTSSTAPAPCRGMDRIGRQHLGRQAVPESRRPRWALHGLPARSWRADRIPTLIMTQKGRLFRYGRRAHGGTAWLTNEVFAVSLAEPSPAPFDLRDFARPR